jgi:hypothetical protein
MTGNMQVVLALLAFNGLFLGTYLYRRLKGKRSLPSPLSLAAQGIFVATNCLILFLGDAQRYVDWIIGNH